MISIDFTYLLLGLVVGFMTGATGMGATSIATPALLLFGVRPLVAVGANLVYVTLTKLAASWVHWRQGMVDQVLVRRLAVGSIPGAIAGTILVAQFQRIGFDADEYVRRAIGSVLIVIAAVFFLRGFGLRRFSGIAPGRLRSLMPLWAAGAGLAVGVTSIGGGSLITPLLMATSPTSPEKVARVIGTSLVHATLLTLVASLLYFQFGAIEWPIVFSLTLGSVPGTLLGSYLTPHAPPRLLRVSLALILLASGIRLV